jgi:hypothetical protein
MAGSPVALITPYVKKYIIEIIALSGPLFYLLKMRRDNKIYRQLYSKNDFERQYTLDALQEHLTKH